MKDIVRALLVLVGVLGLFVTVPLAIFAFTMLGGGDHDERVTFLFLGLLLPGLCVAALIAGLWPSESARGKDGKPRPPSDL